MDNELIEKLLQTTGLSCDDLLSKLQQYRFTRVINSNEPEPVESPLFSDSVTKNENSVDGQQCTTSNDKSVILETKSSTVDLNNDTNLKQIHSDVESCDNSEDVTTVCVTNTVEECIKADAFQNSEDTVGLQQNKKNTVNSEESETVNNEESNITNEGKCNISIQEEPNIINENETISNELLPKNVQCNIIIDKKDAGEVSSSTTNEHPRSVDQVTSTIIHENAKTVDKVSFAINNGDAKDVDQKSSAVINEVVRGDDIASGATEDPRSVDQATSVLINEDRKKSIDVVYAAIIPENTKNVEVSSAMINEDAAGVCEMLSAITSEDAKGVDEMTFVITNEETGKHFNVVPAFITKESAKSVDEVSSAMFNEDAEGVCEMSSAITSEDAKGVDQITSGIINEDTEKRFNVVPAVITNERAKSVDEIFSPIINQDTEGVCEMSFAINMEDPKNVDLVTSVIMNDDTEQSFNVVLEITNQSASSIINEDAKSVDQMLPVVINEVTEGDADSSAITNEDPKIIDQVTSVLINENINKDIEVVHAAIIHENSKDGEISSAVINEDIKGVDQVCLVVVNEDPKIVDEDSSATSEDTEDVDEVSIDTINLDAKVVKEAYCAITHDVTKFVDDVSSTTINEDANAVTEISCAITNDVIKSVDDVSNATVNEDIETVAIPNGVTKSVAELSFATVNEDTTVTKEVYCAVTNDVAKCVTEVSAAAINEDPKIVDEISSESVKNEDKNAAVKVSSENIENVADGHIYINSPASVSRSEKTITGTTDDFSKERDFANPTLHLNVDRDLPTSSAVDLEREVSTSSTDDFPTSEDSLRNVLRMQLSSLRNMKKSSGYLPDFNKRSMFFHNLKKKRKSCDVNPLKSLNAVDSKSEDEEEDHGDENETKELSNKEVSSNENSLVSLSENTDFVIMNVTGGVDRLTPDLDSENNEERRFAAITDTNNKTTDVDMLSNINNNTPLCDNTMKSSASPSKEIKNILTNYRRKMSLNYFDENRYKFATPRNEEKPANLMVKKSISENFKKDPGINKSVKNNEKSPFVSDTLEDFLNESAQLKISYAIPKLGAEDGISESSKKSPFDDVVSRIPKVDATSEQDSYPKEKPKLIKAKTLADMRRHFEKLHGKNKSATSPYSKKNKAAVSKNFSQRKGLNNVDSVVDVAPHRNSFVMYNNRKVWVPGKVKDKCVAVIDFNSTKEIPHEKTAPSPAERTSSRKPSLLSALAKQKPCKIKYKPGPLCKKANLQNDESKGAWRTELKTLPKIYLGVVPEVNKPIDRKLLHLLPVFDDVVITEERTNFALSVLKSKNEVTEPKSFNFHIPYNNKQEKMVVRKRFKPSACNELLDKSESDPTTVIASVLSDIISYIEVKEIENTIIKEDDLIAQEPDVKLDESPPIVKTKARKIKRKKLDLELLRLNCKVIDVATNESDDKVCLKPYCRMGCVCKSLLCESIFSNHCQLVDCMFGCSCPPTTSNEMMAANNSLSVHTVNHLEDKAKKDLAKEEREFTQTLIHTDNDVILLGTGKLRRTSKLPKKYTDYVGDIDVVLENTKSVIPESKQLNLKNCTVVASKLDLNDVIPYCLYHKMYNCHCKGNYVDPSPPKTKPVEPKLKAIDSKAKTPDQIPKIRIVKTKEDLHKSWYNSCARIRKIFPEYKVRNKDPLYNEKLRNKNFYFKPTTSENDSNTFLENFCEASLKTYELKNRGEESCKKASKRKQSFNVREDPLASNLIASGKRQGKEFALQRRKKKMKPKAPPTSRVLSHTTDNIFDGEIKVPLKENQEMLTIIGEENASLEYLRILPWTKLIQSFRTRKINIWSKEKRTSALLCNAAGYFPPKNFYDIRKIVCKSEIINWILTDTLPPDRPRDLMHLILTPKKNHFLIAGYCLKKISDNQAANSESAQENSILEQELEIVSEPVEHSASPKSSESRSSFEELPADNLDEKEINLQTEIVLNSILKPLELRTNNRQEHQPIVIPKEFENEASPKLQSILISKLLDSKAKMNRTRPTSASKQIQIGSKLKSIVKPSVRKRLKLVPVNPLEVRTLTPLNSKNLLNIKKFKFVSSFKKPSELIPYGKQGQSTPNLTEASLGAKVRPDIFLSKDSDFIVSQAQQSSMNLKSDKNLTIKSILKSTSSEYAKNTLLEQNIFNSVSSNTNQMESSRSSMEIDSFETSDPFQHSGETTILDESDDSEPIELQNAFVSESFATETSSNSEVIELQSAFAGESFEEPTSNSEVLELQSSSTAESVKCGSNSITESSESAEVLDANSKTSKPKESEEPVITIHLDEDPAPPKATSQSSPVKSRRKQLVTTPPKSSSKTNDCEETTSNSQQKKRTTPTPQKPIPSRSLKCTHKNIDNKSKTLVLTNKEFIKRKLYCDKDNKGVEILAPLPKVSKNCRWRMIYLNSDFTFLTFVRANYSIKYTDLLDVVKMSCNIKSTITLRNTEFSDHYKHPIFGICCLPDYQDRLFIGPYFPTEKHNIETLRYLQGRLIDTQIFNKMVGKKINDKRPVWIYETPCKPKAPLNDVVIDITEDDDEREVTIVDLDSDDSEGPQEIAPSQDLLENLLCPPFVEELTQEELKGKSKINRYIVTNIPHLGYFSACQRNTTALEVYWPNHTKGYRFPNVTFAKNLFVQYLSQIFCPIPQDFKIKVIIMTHLDVRTSKLVDPKYLSPTSSYFCGEFGIYDKANIPDDILKKYNVSSVDTLLKSHQEAAEQENTMIRLFGLFLMSNEELRKHSDAKDILLWASSEIYILKKLCENYESEKADLQNIIRVNAQKIKNSRKELRERESNHQTTESVAEKLPETIEIEDSDEEENQTVNTQITTPVFRKICTSGRIDTGGNGGTIYQKNDDRSLLKPKFWMKPGRSLLKTSEKEGANTEKLPIQPVQKNLSI